MAQSNGLHARRNSTPETRKVKQPPTSINLYHKLFHSSAFADNFSVQSNSMLIHVPRIGMIQIASHVFRTYYTYPFVKVLSESASHHHAYSWRPEVFRFPIWDRLKTKLRNLKIEFECEQATAMLYPCNTSALLTR